MMRFVSVRIFAIFMWGVQFGIPQYLYNLIKKEALTKVDIGLGSLSGFTAKLTAKKSGFIEVFNNSRTPSTSKIYKSYSVCIM